MYMSMMEDIKMTKQDLSVQLQTIKDSIKAYIDYLRLFDFSSSKEEINHIIKNNICSSLEEIIK